MKILGKFLALVATMATVTGVALPPAGASTAGQWFTWSQDVSLTGQKWDANARTCVEWHFRGKIKFSAIYYTHFGNLSGIRWKNPRLVDPTISISTYDRCVSHYYDYRKKVLFNQLQVGGRIYGSNDEACEYNTDFTLSLPWGIAMNVTPECGSVKTASHWNAKSTQTSPASLNSTSFTVSGKQAQWSIDDSTQQSFDEGRVHWVCFSGGVSYRLWRIVGSSDNVYAGRGKAAECINMYDMVP